MNRKAASEADARWMTRALALAARGLGRTHPNPPVGALLVRDGRVLGEGFHARAGGPHAEVEALRRARQPVRGATLYVTLEPCSHHGRTPPCVDALLPLGLRRVVVAMVDPNPRVRGRGIRALRRAGIPVVVGPGAEEARRLTAGYRTRLLHGRPRIILKLATTLDGRIATASGDSRWLTGPTARRAAHQLRNVVDAVLIGAETVRRDNPRLTCRLRGGHDPERIVLSGARLAIPRRARILRPPGGRTLILAPAATSQRRVAALTRSTVEVVLLPGAGVRIPFTVVARALGRRGITTLLIEGGGEVAAEALRARLVDELVLFIAPRLLGGDARAAVGALRLPRVARTIALADMHTRRLGVDLVVHGRVRYPRVT